MTIVAPSFSALKRRPFSARAPMETQVNDPEIFGSVFKDDLSLISSVHGKLERLLLTIPNYVFDDNDAYQAAYKKMLEVLPLHTTLDIVVNEKNSEKLTAWVNLKSPGRSVNLYAFPNDLKFTVWAEDGYLSANSDDGTGETYFIEPYEFKRSADSVIADFVSNASNINNTSAPLYFEGGNVLIGDDFFLVGRDYPKKTISNNLINISPSAPKAEKTKKLKEAYTRYLDSQRKVMFPGTAKIVPGEKMSVRTDGDIGVMEVTNRGTGELQPIFHIDMCISLIGRLPGGKYEVLVGDTQLAETLLGVNWGEASLSSYFNELAEDMKNLGFEVTRNPLPLAYRDFLNGSGQPAII